MDTRRWSAILVAIMALAGCLGSTEPFLKLKSRHFDLQPRTHLDSSPSDAQLGEEITYVLGIKQEGEGGWTIDATVLQPNFSPLADIEWTEIDNGYQLKFTPTETGEHIISISIENDGETELVPALKPLVMTLSMNPPDEPAPVLTVPNQLVLEEPNVLWFEGSVNHLYVDSCTVSYSITDGSDGTMALNENGAWKFMMDFTEATHHTPSQPPQIVVVSVCQATLRRRKCSLRGPEMMRTRMASKMCTTAVLRALVRATDGDQLQQPTATKMDAEMTTKMTMMTTMVSSTSTTFALNPTAGSARHQ